MDENADQNVGPEATLIGALVREQAFMQRLAQALTRDHSAAHDLVQETSIAALRSDDARGNWGSPRGLRAWLATTMRRRAIDGQRDEARRSQREERAAHEEGVPSHEERIDRRLDAQSLIARALAKLPADQRHVVALRYGEDLPPRQIARRLNAPVATVKTRLRRALASLRVMMDQRHGGSRRSWILALEPTLPSPGLGAASSLWVLSAASVVAMIGVAHLGSTNTPLSSRRAGDSEMARPQVSPVPAGDQDERARTPQAIELDAEPIAPGDESRVMGWRIPDDVATSVLRVELNSEDDRPPRGRIRFVSPAATEDRDVELRGHPSSGSLAIRVPASTEVFVELRLDGFEEQRIRTDTGVESTWAAIDYAPVRLERSSLVDLIPSGHELIEGSDYHVSLEPVVADLPTLHMPLQKARCEAGRLRLGRIPAGDYRVWFSTHVGGYSKGQRFEWVADQNIEVAPGGVSTAQLNLQKGGTIKLDVVDPEGNYVGGEFTIVTESGRRLRPGARSEGGRLTTGEGPQLHGDGPVHAVPRHLPPGANTVEIDCPGFEPVSKVIRVESDSTTEVFVELERSKSIAKSSPKPPSLVWPQPIDPEPTAAIAAWTSTESFRTSVLRVAIETEGENSPAGLVTFVAESRPQRVVDLTGHPSSALQTLRVRSDTHLIVDVDADGYARRTLRMRTPRARLWGRLQIDLEPLVASGTLTVRVSDEHLIEGQELTAILTPLAEDTSALLAPSRRVLHRDGRIPIGRLPAGTWKVDISTDTGWPGDPKRAGTLTTRIEPSDALVHDMELSAR